ncbi:7-carboxy-7-deazaguanine synthase QueE [uncultured Paludibaculum sp.]|uniref:7-carboxy-7-deazaguanine synthase QueE n=1 Tax=uncultured Paludibaculum sp. TaxID=1765020 RepID=UPI002AAB1E6F|nr:7-carboxy-7-deazaguanine synthase QueE [uncultured Paludibaculum sp.]
MRISEIFTTIQGEGLLTGVPSLFIRVSGCNLRCVWCDTPYTSWQPEGEEMELAALLRHVEAEPVYRHIVLTGGEPMLFGEVVELTAALRAMDRHITVETAGTVWQPVECDLMSISPKLRNSTPWDREGGRYAASHERLRYRPDVLSRLVTEYDYQLKFVVTEPGDLEEIRKIASALHAKPERVLLMPEGISADRLHERAAWLVELCKENGYRFCPRLHVLLYGNRRGV